MRKSERGRSTAGCQGGVVKTYRYSNLEPAGVVRARAEKYHQDEQQDDGTQQV